MEDLRASVGRVLRRLRQERGLSLQEIEELTERAGHRVSRSRLSLLERGESAVQLEDLRALSRAYGFSVIDMLTEALAGVPDRRFPPGKSAEELFEEGKELFRSGRQLQAAWTFDAAWQRVPEDDPDKRTLYLTAAAHAYERAGAYALAVRRIEQALDVEPQPVEERVRALLKYADMLSRSGSHARAADQLRVVASLAGERLSQHLRAYSLDVRAHMALRAGDAETARTLAIAAARAYRAAGDVPGQARALASVARAEWARGRKRSAGNYARRAEEVAREGGRVDCQTYVLLTLGEILAGTGEDDAAYAALKEVAELASRHGFDREGHRAYELLERLAQARGRASEAARWRRRRGRLTPLLGADLSSPTIGPHGTAHLEEGP